MLQDASELQQTAEVLQNGYTECHRDIGISVRKELHLSLMDCAWTDAELCDMQQVCHILSTECACLSLINVGGFFL